MEIDPQTSSQVTKIIRGDLDFMVDNPPPDRVAELKSKYKDRFEQFPTNSTFYFFMNTEAPPFDDLKVRQAVNYAIDVNAINRAQGGVLSPAHTTLPPGVPGYDGSQSDLYPFDLDKAKSLIKESGDEGDDVTVWSNPEPETQRTMEYYADTLNKIGLNAKIKNIPAEEYFVTIGTRKNKAQTGWANWFQDYPHPSDFIDILLNPDNVVRRRQQQLHLQRHRQAARAGDQRAQQGAGAHRRGQQALGRGRPGDPGEGVLGDLREPQAVDVLL